MADLEQETEFAQDPRGQAQRWAKELTAARKEVEKFHERGKKCLERFRDERKTKEAKESRLNLFSANVKLQADVLYGKTPRVDVSRRYADADDDVARVASEMLERALNNDIEADADGYPLALQYALMDRLVPGLGMARVRYVAEFDDAEDAGEVDPAGDVGGEAVEGEAEEPAEAGGAKLFEDAVVDYVAWNDVLVSPARTWHEVRWVGFRAPMSREDLIERFGDVGKLVPLNAKKGKADNADLDARKEDPWGRADVWEVWCKDEKRVYWYVDGFEQVLDVKDDPLQLKGFLPCPRPMAANLTTESIVPTPDYALAQDLYEEINLISTRIKLLVKALRVAGVYDKNAGALQRLLGEASENELIPVDNWAAFVEKGAVQGSIAWLPLEQIVAALDKLREYRAELIALCDQVTGMSDILRGAASDSAATATESRLKGGYGSVRLQALQEDFARFASDLQRLRAEVMCRHFDPNTIVERSNIMATPDAQFVPQAVALLQSGKLQTRVQVRPENVAMQDFARMKSERIEVVSALGQFLGTAAPLVQQMPGSMPAVLKLMKWVVGGVKGAQEAEAILDAAVAEAESAAQQPQAATPPDPKLLAAQMKGQADLQKVQLEHQADMQKLQAEAVLEDQKQRSQTMWNIREEAARARIKATVSPHPGPVVPR